MKLKHKSNRESQWKQKQIFIKDRKNESLASLSKKKREKTQVTNIRNEQGDFNTDPTDFKRIIREYRAELYTHKFTMD